MAGPPAGQPKPEAFTVDSGGVALSGEEEGEGPAIVTIHGLTSTRRVVLHGSRHLPRAGFQVIAYDARGHGTSAPGPVGSYDYDHLGADVAAVAEARAGEGRVVLAGHSMGAHTIAALALSGFERLAAAVFIGPAAMGTPSDPDRLAYWDRLADGLEEGGVEGFIAAYDQDLNPEWRETVLRIARQRLSEHEHPEAVAQALREIPRAQVFDGIQQLSRIDVPALVVASHDEADPGHPYDVADAWAEHLPQARLVSEEPGESPLAWQGGRLSRVIEEFCRSPEVRERLEG